MLQHRLSADAELRLLLRLLQKGAETYAAARNAPSTSTEPFFNVSKHRANTKRSPQKLDSVDAARKGSYHCHQANETPVSPPHSRSLKDRGPACNGVALLTPSGIRTAFDPCFDSANFPF